MQSGNQAIREALAGAMQADPGVVLLGDSVGRDGGVAGTSHGLLQRFGADRVVDLPVADRAALGFAVGLALGGRRPVVELSSTGRLPAIVEVLADAARASGGDFSVPLVVRVPYGTEAPGLDRGLGELLATGVTVACASDAVQAAGLLRTALSGAAPVVLLEPRAIYGSRVAGGEVPVPYRVRLVRDGAHVTIAAWGAGVAAAEQAAEQLATEGISAAVLDLVALAPVDRQALGEILRRTGRLVVAHAGEPAVVGLVRQAALDEAFLYLEAPMADAPEDATALVEAVRTAVRY